MVYGFIAIRIGPARVSGGIGGIGGIGEEERERTREINKSGERSGGKGEETL
jgi:hypothetical protein